MKERIEKVKTHFSENKNTYIGLGVGTVLGAVGLGVLTKTNSGNSAVQKVIAFKTGDITQNVTQALVRRGHPGYIVQCVETGESFASIRRASEMLKISRSELSKHLNGLKDSVGGFTFEILGEATK